MGSLNLPGKDINSDFPVFNVSKIDGDIQNLESSETQWKKINWYLTTVRLRKLQRVYLDGMMLTSLLIQRN